MAEWVPSKVDYSGDYSPKKRGFLSQMGTLNTKRKAGNKNKCCSGKSGRCLDNEDESEHHKFFFCQIF